MEACCQLRTGRTLTQQYNHLLTTEEAEPPELTVGTHRLPMGEVGFAEDLSCLLYTSSSVKDALLFNLLSYLSDQLLTKGNTVAALDELYLWLSNLTASSLL